MVARFVENSKLPGEPTLPGEIPPCTMTSTNPAHVTPAHTNTAPDSDPMLSPPEKSQLLLSPGGREREVSLVWDSGMGGYVPRCCVPQPKVYVRVVFLKIGEIDTVKEKYEAEVFVQARWREPALDRCTNVEDIQFQALWNPELQLENAMDDPSGSLWYDLTVTDSGEAYVLEKRRVKASFYETLELHSFPFDVQHLSVLITSRLSDTSLELLEDDQEVSSVNLLSFVDQQEWQVREIVECIPEIRSREFSAIKHKFPILTVRTYVVRHSGFFIWNVLAIMVLICSLSLCTFAVSRSLPQNRLQLSFTLVLTGVAFKFVAEKSLPKISYLTLLDKYILGSMLLMYLVSVWHAVLTRIADSQSKTLDEWVFVVLVLTFCVYNIVFAVTLIVKVYKQRQCVTILEEAYRTKLHKQGSSGGLQIQVSTEKETDVQHCQGGHCLNCLP